MPVDFKNTILGDGQHPTRATAGIVDGTHDMVLFKRLLGQYQVHHQANYFTWREVFTRILIQSLVEFADEFLEDITHFQVRNFIGVKVYVLKFLHHEKEKTSLLELCDGIIEFKLLQDLAHVIAEAVDVGSQVRCKVRSIIQQS